MRIELTDVDRRIWAEELEGFVPRRIFDAHAHLYLAEHELRRDGDPPSPASWINRPCERGDRAVLDACCEVLLPGREVSYLGFAWVFRRPDWDAANAFVAREMAADPRSAALMILPGSATGRDVAEAVDGHGFVGLKPYRYWSTTGDDIACRITEMISESALEVADERGLIVLLHVSKRRAIADEENISDFLRLTKKYSRVRWILPHLGRSQVSWPLERVVDRLKDLPNVWYDFSGVCDSDVISVALQNLPLDRIMYGSDNLPFGLLRGTYVGFGFAWAYLDEPAIAHLDLAHCDGRPTFVLYESLRAARRAMTRHALSTEQIEDVFCNNAMELLHGRYANGAR